MTSHFWVGTLTCRIIVQQILFFFGEKNTYTTLLGPTRLLTSKLFPSKHDSEARADILTQISFGFDRFEATQRTSFIKLQALELSVFFLTQHKVLNTVRSKLF